MPESSPRTRHDAGRGLDAMTRLGTALVAVGALATVVTLLPLFTDLGTMPVVIYLLCFMAPLGLGVILVALWRRARTRRARMGTSRGGMKRP